MRTANDAARTRTVIVGTNIDLTPADRLAVGMNLDLVRQHLADHERAGDLGPHLVDGLDLQARSDQRLSESATVKIIRQRSVFAQPAQRRPHNARSRLLLRVRRGFKGVVPLAILIARSRLLLRVRRGFKGVVPLAISSRAPVCYCAYGGGSRGSSPLL